MVELIDSPLIPRNKHKKGHWLWVVLTAAALLLSYAGWSRSALIPVGNAQGLDVQIDFKGYSEVAQGGVFAYKKGKTLHYQVVLTNKTNATLSSLEVQSMVRGIKTKLPGALFSPAHKTSLSPGQTYKFDVEYQTPDLNEVVQANLVVNTRYTHRGTLKSDSFLCPTPVRFE